MARWRNCRTVARRDSRRRAMLSAGVMASTFVIAACHNRSTTNQGPNVEPKSSDSQAVKDSAEIAAKEIGGDFASLIAQGDVLVLQGDTAAAIPYFARAIRVQPERTTAMPSARRPWPIWATSRRRLPITVRRSREIRPIRNFISTGLAFSSFANDPI